MRATGTRGRETTACGPWTIGAGFSRTRSSDALAEFQIDRIVSSPYLRCVQTVEPLAEARGLEIELDEQLGATRLDEVGEVLERLRGENVAVCTHGDLPWLGDRKFKKGATWVVDDRLVPERYIKPPA